MRARSLLFLTVAACLWGTLACAGPAAAFSDVPPGHFAYNDVNLLVDLGLVSGYWDGLYHPEYTVDRGQMAAYIGRTLRSRYVSPKIGWTQHVAATDDYVIAPVEMQADAQDDTAYRLYTSTDGRTWALDSTATFYYSTGFFGGQFVWWTVHPSEYSTAFFRPMVLVKGVEVPLCGVIDHWPEGDGNALPLIVIDRPLPILCWEPYSLTGAACVAYYVVYVNSAVRGTVYCAVVDGSLNRLGYGHEVGFPGILAAETVEASLIPGDYTAAFTAIDMFGSEVGRTDVNFTVY